MMNARTKLTIENSVDVQSRKVWVVSKKFVDGLPDTCESGGSILKLQQLLDTNSVRYAVSDSGDMRSLVFQVFLRLQS